MTGRELLVLKMWDTTGMMFEQPLRSSVAGGLDEVLEKERAASG